MVGLRKSLVAMSYAIYPINDHYIDIMPYHVILTSIKRY